MAQIPNVIFGLYRRLNLITFENAIISPRATDSLFVLGTFRRSLPPFLFVAFLLPNPIIFVVSLVGGMLGEWVACKWMFWDKSGKIHA
jgi:hypothetical protein